MSTWFQFRRVPPRTRHGDCSLVRNQETADGRQGGVVFPGEQKEDWFLRQGPGRAPVLPTGSMIPAGSQHQQPPGPGDEIKEIRGRFCCWLGVGRGQDDRCRSHRRAPIRTGRHGRPRTRVPHELRQQSSGSAGGACCCRGEVDPRPGSPSLRRQRAASANRLHSVRISCSTVRSCWRSPRDPEPVTGP